MDKLATYGLDTKMWITQNSTISNSNNIALEALLQTKSEIDLLDMRSEWEQVFTGTIPKEVGAAGLGEASVAARPAGPNLQQHVWLLKIPSPTTNPLRFSRIPKDS